MLDTMGPSIRSRLKRRFSSVSPDLPPLEVISIEVLVLFEFDVLEVVLLVRFRIWNAKVDVTGGDVFNNKKAV